MSVWPNFQDQDHQGTRGLPMVLLGFLLLQALAGCGGGSNGQSAVSMAPAQAPAPSAAPPPQPPIQGETGDAWQERYVGTVTIGGVQYFGDAMLTADGLIRLYVGGPYADDGLIPQGVPASSAQLVGTLHGKTNQISGDGLVFGQQCEAPDPIQFCAEIGQASISIAVTPTDTFASIFTNIQGNILVTTSTGTDTWSLNMAAFSNYYVDLPATQGGLAGNYNEEVADFALNGDTIISIDAQGMLSLQSPSTGCAGNGQIRPHLNGAVNVYDVSLTISGCNAHYNNFNSTFDGLATTSPSDEWNYDSNLRMWLSQPNADASGSSPPVLTTWAEAQY